jgi:hypothetical protein
MAWLIVGMFASFVGAVWAQFERANPHYALAWGLSRNTANVVNILTTALFPGGYLLILLAPGHGWPFNIGMLVLTHIVVVQVLAGLASGVIAGVADRRRARQHPPASPSI